MRFDILGLFPPSSEDAATTRWRQVVAMVLLMLIGSNLALAAGLVREEVRHKTLEDIFLNRANRIEARIIAGNIFAMWVRYCEASKTGNAELALVYDTQVTLLQLEYRTLMNVTFPSRSCELPGVRWETP